jgi:hypothetical protein
MHTNSLESNMTKFNQNKSEAARFISWNDGTIDARNGAAERSKDVDYIAGYRYGQDVMTRGA